MRKNLVAAVVTVVAALAIVAWMLTAESQTGVLDVTALLLILVMGGSLALAVFATRADLAALWPVWWDVFMAVLLASIGVLWLADGRPLFAVAMGLGIASIALLRLRAYLSQQRTSH